MRYLFSPFVLVLGVALLLGVATLVGPSGIFSSLEDLRLLGSQRVLIELRLPRVLSGFLVGGALSLAGLLFQVIFRNELATPCTLGVTGGASLGVALWALLVSMPFMLGVSASLNVWGSIVAAFAGAVASVGFVLLLGRFVGGAVTVSLLLAGIVVNATLAAFVQCIVMFASPNEVFSFSRWASGSLAQLGYSKFIAFTPAYIVQMITVLILLPELSVLLVGSEQAESRGVSVVRVQRMLLMSSALCVGSAVALFGPITFLGIVVPFIGRVSVGMQLGKLVAFCLLGGGCFLVVIDTFARTIAAPLEIPVGVFTALLGGPFFLYLLLRRGWSSSPR